jgi:hypothetical protein
VIRLRTAASSDRFSLSGDSKLRRELLDDTLRRGDAVRSGATEEVVCGQVEWARNGECGAHQDGSGGVVGAH